MATAKIISSSAGKHRVHFEFKLDHIATFTQKVLSKHPNPSPELTGQFNDYARDYLRGFLNRREFVQKELEVDIAWQLSPDPEPPQSGDEGDKGVSYYLCDLVFPVRGLVRKIADVDCDFDALALGQRLQDIADSFERDFLRDNHLAPLPPANVEPEAVEQISIGTKP